MRACLPTVYISTTLAAYVPLVAIVARIRRQVPVPVSGSLAPRSILDNLVSLATGQALTWVLTGLTLALAARYLGPSDFGKLSLALSVSWLLVGLCSLGLPTLVTKSVARNGAAAFGEVSAAAAAALVAGAVAGALVVAALPFLPYDGETVVLVVLAIAGVPVLLLLGIAIALLQGLQQMRYQAIFDVCLKLMALVAVVAVLPFGGSLVLYGVVSLLLTARVALGMTILTVVVARVRLRQPSPRDMVRVARQALPLYSLEVFALLYISIDVLLLSVLAQSEDIGMYAAPMRIFGAMLFLPALASTVLFPRLAAFGADQGSGEFISLSKRALVAIALLTTPLAFVGCAVSGELALVILGDGFDDAAAVTSIIAISVVPTSFNIVLARSYIATDQQFRWTWIMVGAVIAKLALGAVLIVAFEARSGQGALGAVIGLVVVEFGQAAIATVLAPPALRSALVRGRSLRCWIAVVSSLAVLLAATPLGLFVAGLAALATFAALVALLGVVPLDRARFSLELRYLREA